MKFKSPCFHFHKLSILKTIYYISYIFLSQGYLEGQSLTSGSGSGHPRLVRRTLAKHVSLAGPLSSGSDGGKFGREVWRGIWHGENVAVKIYFSRDEDLWKRETEVYTKWLTSRHDNILGYVGSDVISRAGCTQLWIVTDYHPLGSLYNYLVKVGGDFLRF